jgi:branched-chain amino acid transport system permease protein
VITTTGLSAGILNGLCLAGIYVLVALGMTLILSIMNILQFAHGEVFMLGAFVTYFVVVRLGGNIFLAVLLAMVAVGLLGFILERLVFRPLIGKFTPVVCAATGLMLILQTTAVVSFGLNQKQLPSIMPGGIRVLGFVVPYDRLLALATGFVLTAILFMFLRRTRLGLAITATSQNREGALLQGINPKVMYSFVMTIGSALAAVGGSFAGSIFTLDPFMGSIALMKGFTIIVIGGMGSIGGVVVGGLLLGLSDSLTATLFSPAVAAIFPLILVIVVLVVRPKGLWGHET